MLRNVKARKDDAFDFGIGYPDLNPVIHASVDAGLLAAEIYS